MNGIWRVWVLLFIQPQKNIIKIAYTHWFPAKQWRHISRSFDSRMHGQRTVFEVTNRPYAARHAARRQIQLCVFGGGFSSPSLIPLTCWFSNRKNIYKLETNRNASETNLSVQRSTVGHLISRCDCNSILTECVSPNMQIHSNLHLYIKLHICIYIQHPFRMHIAQ